MAAERGARIRHCTDEEFHAAFRADLLNLQRQAIVLSPFLHPGRASHYYVFIDDLVRRGVTVEIYTKPNHEIDAAARENHARVQSSLRATGAALHERAGMHEKVAALDGRILWHGSLNILSHNATRESMLRIELPDLVTETLLDLKLIDPAEAIDDDDSAWTGPGPGPACPICEKPMHYSAETALWICSDLNCSGVRFPTSDEERAGGGAALAADASGSYDAGGHAPDAPGTYDASGPADDDHIQARRPGPVPAHGPSQASDRPPGTATPELDLLCPRCDAPLHIRRGAVVRVVCSSAACDFAFDPRLSRWLVRSARRRRSS